MRVSYFLTEAENDPADPCPISKTTNKHSKDDNDSCCYVSWIRRMAPRIHNRDERVYCPYCDVKNHPHWTCAYGQRHTNKEANHPIFCALVFTRLTYVQEHGAMAVKEHRIGRFTRRKGKRREAGTIMGESGTCSRGYSSSGNSRRLQATSTGQCSTGSSSHLCSRSSHASSAHLQRSSSSKCNSDGVVKRSNDADKSTWTKLTAFRYGILLTMAQEAWIWYLVTGTYADHP